MFDAQVTEEKHLLTSIVRNTQGAANLWSTPLVILSHVKLTFSVAKTLSFTILLFRREWDAEQGETQIHSIKDQKLWRPMQFQIKVMQKISADYEELKKAFESQKCPKDDKIQALRSTGGQRLE